MHATSLVLGALVIVAGCTDESNGNGGGGGTSRVVTIEFMASAGGACVDGTLADVDDTVPGQQYDCTASDLRNAGTANETETVLPMCNNAEMPAMATNKPCWAVIVEPVGCTMTDHLRVVVERAEPPAPDTLVRVHCAAP